MTTRTMPRVCIITPSHLSLNPRVLKEADALQSAGLSVRVIATDHSDMGRALDATLAPRAWQVAAKPQFGPRAPTGARLGQFAANRLARFIVNASTLAPPQVLNAAWHPAGPALARAASRVPADLYIAHYPAALYAAASAAGLHGGRYAYDAEDFHLGDDPDEPAFDRSRALLRRIEGRWLPGAAYVTAAAPLIADAYRDAYGIPRPEVVLNVFPMAAGADEATPMGAVAPRPSLYWFSQTIGPDRGLQTAVRAVATARHPIHLYLRGRPIPSFAASLRELAASLGIADRLHFLEPAPPDELERIGAGFDMGLVGELGHTLNRRIALTNKLFSYWSSGLPAVASDIPAHRALAAEAGAALHLYRIEDPASLASALDGLLEAPHTLGSARLAAHRLARSRFNWELEQEKLLATVDRAMRSNALPQP